MSPPRKISSLNFSMRHYFKIFYSLRRCLAPANKLDKFNFIAGFYRCFGMIFFFQNVFIMFDDKDGVTNFKIIDKISNCFNRFWDFHLFPIYLQIHYFVTSVSRAVRYCLASFSGLSANNIPDKTATPWAPTWMTSGTRFGVIPPIAMTGILQATVISFKDVRPRGGMPLFEAVGNI